MGGQILMSLSEGQIARLKKIINHQGEQAVAIRLIDNYLKKYSKSYLTSSDLPDTATYGSGVEEIQEFLREGEFETAYNIASDTAADMLEDEGFEVVDRE